MWKPKLRAILGWWFLVWAIFATIVSLYHPSLVYFCNTISYLLLSFITFKYWNKLRIEFKWALTFIAIYFFLGFIDVLLGHIVYRYMWSQQRLLYVANLYYAIESFIINATRFPFFPDLSQTKIVNGETVYFTHWWGEVLSGLANIFWMGFVGVVFQKVTHLGNKVILQYIKDYKKEQDLWNRKE